MTKYSELSWLPLSERKNIDLPTIIYEEYTEQNYGGYYELGTKEIVVVQEDERRIAATIAHEFRHYVQYITNRLKSTDAVAWDAGDNYNLSIRKYFRSSLTEMDALLFEYRVAPNNMNTFWLKALVLPD